MDLANAYRLASGLRRLESAGELEVYAHVVFGWWDGIRARFREPDRVVEIQSREDRNELRFLMSGSGAERALTVDEVASALLELPAAAAAAPMVASVILPLPGGEDEGRFLVNVPVRSVRVRAERRRGRVILSWLASPRKTV